MSLFPARPAVGTPLDVTWAGAADAHGSVVTFSNGMLTVVGVSGTSHGARATVGRSTGKHYFEIVVDVAAAGANSPEIGVASSSWDADNTTQFRYNGATLLNHVNAGDAQTMRNSSGKNSGANYAAGAVIGVAFDMTAAKIWFAKNNAWILSGNPAAGTNETWATLTNAPWFPAVWVNPPSQVTARFKASDFSYTPPSGFAAWQDW